MYLSFQEYETFGGALDEAAFLPFEFEAETFIDWYTFKRIKKDPNHYIAPEVKMCMMALINLIKTKNDLITPNISGGINGNAQIMQQSNDGVSVQYSVLHADEIYYNSKKERDETIKRYLNDVTDSLGRKLLYRGIYPNE
jgi:hypothetical protein